MFKSGDLIKHIGIEWYCLCFEGQVYSILDGTKQSIPGLFFPINPMFWELAYREEKDSETPDALYVPNHELEGINDLHSNSVVGCSCDIVALMQAGCKCGGK